MITILNLFAAVAAVCMFLLPVMAFIATLLWSPVDYDATCQAWQDDDEALREWHETWSWEAMLLDLEEALVNVTPTPHVAQRSPRRAKFTPSPAAIARQVHTLRGGCKVRVLSYQEYMQSFIDAAA